MKNRLGKSLAITAVTITTFAFVLATAGSAVATTGSVMLESDGSTYGSIEAAVGSAVVGDNIIVYDNYDSGVETFPIVVDKAVTIKAAEGAAPVVGGPGVGAVFSIRTNNVDGGTVTINGFKITGDRTADTGIMIREVRAV